MQPMGGKHCVKDIPGLKTNPPLWTVGIVEKFEPANNHIHLDPGIFNFVNTKLLLICNANVKLDFVTETVNVWILFEISDGFILIKRNFVRILQSIFRSE